LGSIRFLVGWGLSRILALMLGRLLEFYSLNERGWVDFSREWAPSCIRTCGQESGLRLAGNSGVGTFLRGGEPLRCWP
jgi:hypothetical protein